MSVAEATGIGAVRAICVALIACFAAARVVRGNFQARGVWLLLVAYMMPPIFTGYHVATTRADAVGWTAEVQYTALLLIRVLPLAVILAWLRPRDGIAEGAHAHALMQRSAWTAAIRWHVRGWWMDQGGCFCAVFLIAFQEFDLAASMNARTWTIGLFDAQAGGLALADSLRLMIVPLLVEVMVISVLFLRWRVAGESRARSGGAAGKMASPALLVVGACCIPFLAPLKAINDGWNGFSAVQDFALAGEVWNCLVLASVASAAAWLLAGWAAGRRGRMLLLALPGLLGALVLSLVVLTVFQWSPLRGLRGSPFPVLSALVLGLMPAALFLRHVVERDSRTEASHAAAAMGGAQVKWALRSRPALLAGALLFVQAYGDFTANSLLAPPALTSAFSRIFNLMHYGRSEILSAFLVVTLVVPIVAVFAGVLIARFHVVGKR